MFTMQLGNEATKKGESRRMDPARQTRSTLYWRKTATTWRSYVSRSRPLEEMTRVAILRSWAFSMPGAPSRLLTTTAISALGMRPAATLSASASKFEPRPLNSTPMRVAINKENEHSRGEGQNREDWGCGAPSAAGGNAGDR